MTLSDILLAREARAQKQKALLCEFRKPLICFTMNIAGERKNSPLITQGFLLGERILKAQLSLLHCETYLAETGCEGYYVTGLSASEAKRICTEIENSLPVGRLFDMDVLDENGQKLERERPRNCLLCDNDARICARSRAHGLAALEEKTKELLQEAVEHERATRIAELATRALLFEVCTTPKPGLVDCNNSGSHRDMNIFSFMASSAALTPYFYDCARLGMQSGEIFPKLRFAGKNAEAAMYRATGGVNTHKGAIFSLGLLCAAAGRAGEDTEKILPECAAICKGVTAHDFADVTENNAKTVGERLYAQYGMTGVRGQAEAGFPAVREIGLPTLREGLEHGLSLHQAGAATLLALLRATQDTNMIARGGMEVYREMLAELETMERFPDEETLAHLDQAFIEKNLSPGGAADLLALTYFLYDLKKENLSL